MFRERPSLYTIFLDYGVGVERMKNSLFQNDLRWFDEASRKKKLYLNFSLKDLNPSISQENGTKMGENPKK